MSHRGMKKWAPFSSLIEQQGQLNKTKKIKNKIEMPILSEEEISEINNALINYQGQTVNLKYYKNGSIILVKTKLNDINAENQSLKTSDGIVYFVNIIEIK